jgi:hypothetical protein
MQDDEITKLLRLKRFEQPPPEYFDRFLQDFRVRQRSQMLREPAWRIGWDRLVAFFGEQMPVRIGYGLASTAVLVAAGIASLDILESHPVVIAETPVAPRVEQVAQQTAPFDLRSSQIQLPDLPSMAGRTAASGSPPRYIMDTRPVSYEQQLPSSF